MRPALPPVAGIATRQEKLSLRVIQQARERLLTASTQLAPAPPRKPSLAGVGPLVPQRHRQRQKGLPPKRISSDCSRPWHSIVLKLQHPHRLQQSALDQKNTTSLHTSFCCYCSLLPASPDTPDTAEHPVSQHCFRTLASTHCRNVCQIDSRS
jgi:hypothetical protein